MSGNGKRPATSPYKAIKKRNANYCGYLSMKDLTPNKAYKIYDMRHTSHEKFGEGELAFIEGKNVKNRVQVPGKYLKELDDDMVQVWYKDIKSGKSPFLIYRNTLPDGSFNIDIAENSAILEQHHSAWDDVPELQQSLSESDSSLNVSNACGKSADTTDTAETTQTTETTDTA